MRAPIGPVNNLKEVSMTKTRLAIALAVALIATPAVSADLATKAPPPPNGAAWSWTGWYAGINIGYGIGDPSITETSSSPFVHINTLLSNSITTSANGFIGGGQVGYNWQATPNWLVGLEADFQGSGQKHTSQFSLFVLLRATDTVGVNLDWFGTVRGRVGYIANGSTLWYVTGGDAYGRTELAFASNNTLVPGIVASGVSKSTLSGWTIGGGVESRLFGNWTAKLEYLYVDLGTISGTASAFIPGFAAPPISVITASAHIRDNIARAGLNYKF
jgi:outer membrane immunogenic protein